MDLALDRPPERTTLAISREVRVSERLAHAGDGIQNVV
jgi:hypothetical protein